MIKMLSWNVNGFRAICAKDDWRWFAETDADIVALQETKAEPEQISAEHREPAGWRSFWQASQGKKGYSGVAVFSRAEPLRVETDLPDADFAGEGRYLHLEYEPFHFLNVYFPNGGMGDARLKYKLGFYDAFLAHAERLRATKPVVVCGDFNTAHRALDLARPKENENVTGFLPVERAWMDRLVAAGYVDTFRAAHGDEPDRYTWWSYKTRARERNTGWRIDYFFVSEELRPVIRDAFIEERVMGSDHCPVGLALDLDFQGGAPSPARSVPAASGEQGLPENFLPLIPDIAAACRDAWHRGLFSGFNGNVSVRAGASCLITRSGCTKSALLPADFAVLDTTDGRQIAGAPASSEAAMHCAVYRRVPEAGAIAHTHPPRLLALEQKNRSSGSLFAPCENEPFERGRLLQSLGRVEAFAPGSEKLASAVAEAMRDYPAVWMRRHGLACYGANPRAALALAEELEHLAAIELSRT